jgi:hypothetical protein
MESDSAGKAMRGRTVFLLASAGHFALTRVTSAMTLSLAGSAAFQESGASYAALGILSKVLYFPVVSLVLYPRGLFPGSWILLPVAVNSLLWGLAVWAVWQLRHKKKKGAMRHPPEPKCHADC